MSGLLEPEGDVGVVLEYKIEDLEATYVVRVVSGKLKDQVISYSPASLMSYSETMCQELGLNSDLFSRYEVAIMNLRRDRLVSLKDEILRALDVGDMEAVQKRTAERDGLYIWDEAPALPVGELIPYLEGLLNDVKERCISLASRGSYREASSCNNTKRAIEYLLSEFRQKVCIIITETDDWKSQSLSPSPSPPSSSTYTADGKSILDVRPLSESLDRESANHIAYSGIFTGHYLPPTGRVDVVIKVGDGRRDLAAEERMLKYLSKERPDAAGFAKLIDYAEAAATVPAYLVLEKYGEDIQAFFKTVESAICFKRYLVELLEAIDSVHSVGVMHGDLKPQNILFRLDKTHIGIKLCDFDNACIVGQAMTLAGFSADWVSPEVFAASQNNTEIKATTAIDVFSLGLILGTLFDGSCRSGHSVLPTEDPTKYRRALSDQEYLDSLLPCQEGMYDKEWVHRMCRIDPGSRCTVRMMIKDMQENSKTKLASDNKFLKKTVESKLDRISNKLDLVLETVTAGFDALKSDFKELIPASFENFFNNVDDENSILNTLLIATVDFSERLKGMKGCHRGRSGDSNLSEAREGLRRMEAAIQSAIESQMSGYEADRRREMAELQTSILTRYKAIEKVLEMQHTDSTFAQTTIDKVSEQVQLLHQEMLDVREELSDMKSNLLLLAHNSRVIVASNEKLRQSIDLLDEKVHRMNEKGLKECQSFSQSLEHLRSAIALTPFIASRVEGVVNETNSLLLTLLKGAYDIPTLVILLPEDKSFFKNPSKGFTDQYRLFFVCSHTLCIAPCGPKGRGYKLTVPREWVKKAAPVLKVGLVAVKLALVASGIPFPISDLLKGLNFSDQTKYFDAALKNLQNISTFTVTEAEKQIDALTKEDYLSFLDRNAEGTRVAYEGIKEMLKNHSNFICNCGLVFVEHNGKVAWVLPKEEENWKLDLGAK